MRLYKIVYNKTIYEIEKLEKKINRIRAVNGKQPVVLSMDVTLDMLISNETSIGRFGDGEFDIIFGRSQGFQKSNTELAKRLKQVLRANGERDNFIVGVPDCFSELSQFTDEAQKHWSIRLDKERIKWYRAMNLNNAYANAQITRFYFDWADKSLCAGWLLKLKKLWNSKDVIIVEGDKTRLGVGNDLLKNANSVKRIIAPAENAFDSYEKIVDSVKSHVHTGSTLLLALGPTATVLAYDLSVLGYCALDVGHIDIEYEWMLKGAREKVIIEGKYVNEVTGGNLPTQYDIPEYNNQIIDRI